MTHPRGGEDAGRAHKVIAIDAGALYHKGNALMALGRYDQAVIAYADTLIRADFDLDKEADAVIWTKKVSNPERRE